MKEPYAYRPIQFFLIANLITWAAWFTAAYFSYQESGGRIYSMLEVVGLFGPFTAAVWMILASGNKELRRNFYDRLVNLTLIKPSSIPAIILIMPAAVIISVSLSHLLFGRSLDQLAISRGAAFSAGFIPVPFMLFGAALIEELGWKGYGVDSLRGERTFFTATAVYAALWAFWHTPLFFINNYYHNIILRTNPLLALNFVASVFASAFIINWLWYKNRGSILTAVLFHAAANLQGLLKMGQTAECIETGVLIVIAAIVVSLNRKMFFKKFPAQIGCF